MDEYDTMQIIRKLKAHFDELSIDPEELQRKLILMKLLAETDDSTVLDENGEPLIFEKGESKKCETTRPITNTMAVDLDKIDISRELALLDAYDRKENLWC